MCIQNSKSVCLTHSTLVSLNLNFLHIIFIDLLFMYVFFFYFSQCKFFVCGKHTETLMCIVRYTSNNASASYYSRSHLWMEIYLKVSSLHELQTNVKSTCKNSDKVQHFNCILSRISMWTVCFKAKLQDLIKDGKLDFLNHKKWSW